MPKALLIDDEPLACIDLRGRLVAHPEIQVVAEAHALAEARAALARNDYDVVFLDVQLRGGNGFDLVPLVRPEARIVFVTGYDRYALRAFDVNALDYLLKPIDSARLAATVRRLVAADASRPAKGIDSASAGRLASAAAETARPVYRIDDSVLLRTDSDAARFVRVGDLAVIFSNENYTELHLRDTKRLFVRRALKAWEEQLPAPDFMRVHRTAIVNLRTVERAAHHDREVTHLFIPTLGAERPVRARRELWPEIERRLAVLGK